MSFLSIYRLLLVVLFFIFYSDASAQEQANTPEENSREVRSSDVNSDLDSQAITLPDSASNKDFDYRRAAGVYGSITSIGSDTLAGLVSLWAERFQDLYPHVKFQIQASGSATASQALTQGTASIGPMSRGLSQSEIQNFTSRYGYPPTALIVAVDAMAIYVEKNNPLQSISLPEIDAVFSMTRLCGAAEPIEQWQQLRIKKFGDARDIQIFGRNSASGTYDLFKSLALCDGDYDIRVNEMPSSSSVVQSVASSIGGIGYAALGHGNTDVKAVPVGPVGGPYYAPNAENVRAQRYPFTRYLYIVVNKAPNEPLPMLERAFLSFILSEEGQKVVEQSNYFAVSPSVLQRQRRALFSAN